MPSGSGCQALARGGGQVRESIDRQRPTSVHLRYGARAASPSRTPRAIRVGGTASQKITLKRVEVNPRVPVDAFAIGASK